jgi:hypothetical protein
MINPWFALTHEAMRLGIDAQRVVALRLMRIAAGGASGAAEARRMVTEKFDAMASAQAALANAMWTGQDGNALALKTISIYGERVRANRRRLSR